MHSVLLEENNIVLQEVAKKLIEDTSSIKDNLYPHIDKILSTSSGKNNYKKCVSKFISDRSQNLYDSVPTARILFGSDDINMLFKSLNLDKSIVEDAIDKTYYGNEPNFSPLSAKDPFTVTMLCIIRFFILHNMKKETELAVLHLSFSGKFYPSLHYRSYQIPPARYVMEYVVNNVLSTKFDLVSEGSVLGCVRKIGNTWINSYNKRFKSFEDVDLKYLIDQLYSRIGSFIKNVAKEYYDTYKDGDYISLAGDSLEEDNYHLAGSDILKVAKFTETTMNYINNHGIDYNVAKTCANSNVSINEIKSIIESILTEPSNSVSIKRLVELMIVTYMQNAKSNEKDVTNPAFIAYSIIAKPNAKQKEIVEQKKIIEDLLINNSTAYIRRRSRLATKNSYEKSLRMYIGITIHNANR